MSRVPIHDHKNIHQGGKLRPGAIGGSGAISDPGSGTGTSVSPATSVTDETTWGITPAVGTDENYAREDHTHGTPTEPAIGSAVGPILITDTPAGSPLVFADLLQTDEGDDLLYVDV